MERYKVVDILKNPLCYAGSKDRIMPLLLANMPQDCTNLVDLFGGSGSCCINMGDKNGIKQVFYNEKDVYIFNLFKMLYNEYFVRLNFDITENIKHFNLSKDDKQSYLNARTYFNDTLKESLFSRSRDKRYWANNMLLTLCFFSFNHYITFNRKGEFTTPAGTHRSSYNKSIKDKLEKFSDKAKNISIKFTNLDFRDFYLFEYVPKCNVKDTLFVIDPPYILSNSQYNRTFGNSWDEQDETDLYTICDIINSSGGKFMLTNLLHSKGQTNEKLLTFSKKYVTIDTYCDFDKSSYQRKNKNTDKEILVKNY